MATADIDTWDDESITGIDESIASLSSSAPVCFPVNKNKAPIDMTDLDSLYPIINSVSPEKNLLAAIVNRAIADIVTSNLRGTSSHSKECVEALNWVKADVMTPFSFVWICQQLGLDHGIVRKRISDIHKESSAPEKRFMLTSRTFLYEFSRNRGNLREARP